MHRTVFGGKITTYRKLAEHALNRLERFFDGLGPAWTADRALPGGGIVDADFDRFLAGLRREHPWLPADLALHYARLYGTTIVFCNRVGSEDGLVFWGHSCVFGPDGEVLGQAPLYDEGLDLLLDIRARMSEAQTPAPSGDAG